MWTAISASPAMQGPATSATVALPSASSLTVTPEPSLASNGLATYQCSLPEQRSESWLELIVASERPYTVGSHSTSTTSATVASSAPSPCATNDGRECTTHAAPAPAALAVAIGSI